MILFRFALIHMVWVARRITATVVGEDEPVRAVFPRRDCLLLVLLHLLVVLCLFQAKLVTETPAIISKIEASV
jgi:hypothetical protein